MDKFFEKIPFIDNILKGIGQIMLQENRWTGLLFLIGIFMGSWQGGVAVIVATATGTYIAMKLNYNKSEINAGLYGFSAALVGVALSFVFQTTLLIWVLIVIGGALASIIQHFFIQKKIPVFTFPFILITWISVFVLHHFTQTLPSEMITAKIEPVDYSDFLTGTNAFGEVIFQGGVLSGVIFFIAVFISSPAAALYGLVGSILGAYISHVNGESIDGIHMGLFGFNAVLSAIVFSGFKKVDGVWVLLSVLITVLIDDFLIDHNILSEVGGVLTFPFVAGTWATLLLQKIFLPKVVSKEKIEEQ
ncbi:urea transporter [Sphingobacterium sp. SRCM116780]|uniref:urea transporter n=1 Tax=Sphingobacterium sp. SRCM116780 TaxID=2907623 RepID=UPI001F21E8BD|nr:urea transporter [Sphingobacterium sp. SRCM116780]UIR55781.1 urea transporter [Sphingobacterium sp. SRCM116780]